MYVQMQQLLHGNALAAFNTATVTAGNETVPHFQDALRLNWTCHASAIACEAEMCDALIYV